MGGRAFDPEMLGRVDDGLFDDRVEAPEDESVCVEACPICGEDVIREADGRLVDLAGAAHRCPEHDPDA